MSAVRPSRPLRAAFFLEQLPILAPMIAAWARAGHEIAAVVFMGRHNARLEWLAGRLFSFGAPHWSLPGTVSRHAADAEIIFLPQPIRWDRLSERIAPLEADVLISAFFPRRIPDALLSSFRLGGVNLHPSRLPHYRGPSPLQHLLLHDAWREHGGVTLHRMSAGLDEGEIIAYAHLDEEHWLDRGTRCRALGGAMANLAANALPAYCRGETLARPQPKKEFAWAGESPDMTVNPNWKAGQLQRLLTFFGAKPGIYVETGNQCLRIGSALAIIGPPEGRPPQRRGRTIEFDLADARVACSPQPWLMRAQALLRDRQAWRTHLPPDIPFIPAARKPAQP